MPIPSGSRLGPYEILALIGIGGMGEVYRAHDARLGRDVAIKVLPHDLTGDPDRLARLEREARALASINHVNIATVHGVEDYAGTRAIVMELVDGEMLSERIARAAADGRAMPLKEVLAIARQIAAALEVAHERGIVHRDLKPANIKVTSSGVVKVLDFGLAKQQGHLGAAGAPTAIGGETEVGTVLGTAPYMSPEQARAQPVDRRTDIWAFGCVLYEMLTNASPFAGDDGADTVAKILRSEPDFGALPRETPAGIRRLLALCLEKDRAKRLAQIAVAAYEIDTAAGGSAAPNGARHRRTAAALAAAMGALVLLGSTAAVWLAQPSTTVESASVTRLFMDVSPAESISGAELVVGPGSAEARRQPAPSRTALAISPDGRTIAFSALERNERALYVRRLDQEVATRLPGTADAIGPFFSPDGRWIAFRTENALRKIPLSGGPPVDIATTPGLFGASWGDDDKIVFASGATGLFEVPAAGGTPVEILARDTARGDVSYRLPHVLPGGQAILFTVTRNRFPRWDQTQIFLYSRATGTAKLLIDGGADARYTTSGHVLYMKEGTLLAAPFDLERLELTGGPIGVVGDVMQSAYARGQGNDTGAGQFTVSATGTLAYLRGGVLEADNRTILRVDRSGVNETLPVEARPITTLRLSPDGQQIAFATSGRDRDIWLFSLVRGASTRLNVDGRHSVPIWTPDGEWITYASAASGVDSLFRVRANGALAAPEPIVVADSNLVPGTWTPDGKELVYYQIAGAPAVFVRDIMGSHTPRPVSAPSAIAGGADLSPDGRWLAYHAAESGRNEVFVQAYPAAERRYQVSTGGGLSPVWRGDGRELFYAEPMEAGSPGDRGIRMMAVAVGVDPELSLSAPVALFEGRYEMNVPARSYDVSRDGQTFFLLRADEQPAKPVTQIVVVQNWFAELDRLVPTR
jgi:serine/threonine-protein kinase